MRHETTIGQLPQIVSWPGDGGAFITLPEVYTEHPGRPGLLHSNLGMYRVQLSGGEYQPDHQIGMHYQIHRSIGVHHAAAIQAGRTLAGEYLCWRHARDDSRRRDAFARRTFRTHVRRALWPAGRCG